MRLKLVLLLLAILSPLTVYGAPADNISARKDQVQAATSNAVDALLEMLSLEQVTPEMTVKDFLDKTQGADRLRETLRRSQQIGGPRWIDKTCEVRLEISGTRARSTLVQIATTGGKKSPVAAEVLSLRLKDWEKRSFAATGSSANSSDLTNAKPAAQNDVWAAVSDDARRAALEAAKDDATSRAMMSLNDIELQPGLRIEDAIRDKAVSTDLHQWLQSRPVTAVDFRQDRQVHVTLNTSPEELAEQIRKSLGAHGRQVGDEAAWARATEAIARKLGASGAIEGVGGLTDAKLPATTAVVRSMPSLPPTWASEQREANGSAPAGASKLKAARTAEAEAVRKLSVQIKELPFTADTTIGQAAERDAQVSQAIERAMAHARTFKVDYLSDGSAQVKVAINLGDVWNELQASQ